MSDLKFELVSESSDPDDPWYVLSITNGKRVIQLDFAGSHYRNEWGYTDYWPHDDHKFGDGRPNDFGKETTKLIDWVLKKYEGHAR